MSTGGSAAKAAAARAAAADEVGEGAAIGLGSGSTALLFVEALGRRLAEGLSIRGGIPTSAETERAARAAGVPVLSFEDVVGEGGGLLDVAVDGADEIDAAGRLIKGGGGCLLREKIVARAARRMVVIADVSKRVERLGAFPLPVEIVPFGAPATRMAVAHALAGATGRDVPVRLRTAGGAPFVTDNGNLIVDCATGLLDDPAAVAAALAPIPGVVEHGLFLEEAAAFLVGRPDGTVEASERGG